ncbi:phosphoribosyltransferase [Thermoflexus sp.]|uniref:phosphoribosyltransferase n=1 Tax=Thermoflexus sp. TaxID=1969742 RepID=UPI0025FDC95E|nr:phosphoribosyltransferase family protein [Thermoflexus sp.]MCS6962592.1 phosphoribosyltransferase family protein [Thermoflexus sp.]MCX7690196.1 phosphoribosyltransferase family protein [Thermoflexus sp.]MDW8183728.1 phosphoribosyltransferase family protein [Anaerolineae bacterium]
MRREILSWGDVEALMDHLLPQLRGPFDALLMITRGGIVPGGMIAEALDIKYILTAAVRFPEVQDLSQVKLFTWPTFLQFPEDELLRGRRVLIVDDVWASGRTINTVRSRVEAAGGYPETAVLHYKPRESLFRHGPTYYAAVTDAYIIYPWELRRGTEGIRPIEPLGG